MPKSRSTTPIPTNTHRPAAFLPTLTSRYQGHDNLPASRSAGEQQPIEHTESRQSLLSPPSQPSASTSRTTLSHSRPTTPTPQRMAKRLRRNSRDSSERISSSRSTPSSEDDSQGGMADTEEHTRHHPSATTSPPPAPTKKKRTRTLTTPHQSAVLHALLAQSRFPTTAMREEVGRSIGLSARKVQIWFQNQRQKARRPRSQTDAPLPRPPQYGPFPNVPESNSAGPSFPGPAEMQTHSDASSGSIRDQRFEDLTQIPTYREYPQQEHYNSETPPALLGPGMPGISSLRPPNRTLPSPPLPRTSVLLSRTSSGDAYANPTTRRSLSPPPTLAPIPNFPEDMPRPATYHGPVVADPSRTLPPLAFGSSSPPYTPYVPRSPESSIFAHRLPEQIGHSVIPPPFTLQPQPQWDTGHFSQVPRPRSSWSSISAETSSSPNVPTSSVSADSIDRDARPRLEQRPPPPPLRPARYDPVRASFVPYNVTDDNNSRSPPKG